MKLFTALSAVLWVPVTSQVFGQRGSDDFPTGFGSSFSLPQSGAQLPSPSVFLPGQSFGSSRPDTLPPFPQPQQPQKDNGQQKKHTYADGTQGDDYPSHMAAKEAAQQQQQQQQLGAGFPNTGQQHLPVPQNPPTQKTHTYNDGTSGMDYPTRMAQKQAQQQQQQQQHPFSVAQSLNSQLSAGARERNAVVNNKNPGKVPHTYPDGTKGHDYPSIKKKQQQQHPFSVAQSLNSQLSPGARERNAVVNTKNPGKVPHTYPDGTKGHDYPSIKKKQQQQQQQQPQQPPVAQFGGHFPAQFSNLPSGSNVKTNPNQVQHTYKDGTTGGDYPTKMAALQRQRQQQQPPPNTQLEAGFSAQFQFPQASSGVQNNPDQVQHTYASGATGEDYPTKMAAQQKLQQQQQQQSTAQFGTGFPVPAPRNQNQVLHTYKDGTTGGNYPAHMAAQKQQQQQQQQQPAVQFGNDFPAQFQTLKVGNGVQKSPTQQGQHVYDDGTTGGDYPSFKAARKQQGKPAGLTGAAFPSAPRQFSAPAPTNAASHLPPQFASSKNSLGSSFRQVIPASSGQKNPGSFPQTRAQVGSSGPFFTAPGLPKGSQTPQGGSAGSGQHTYSDGTTGDDYPSFKAKQAAAASSPPKTGFGPVVSGTLGTGSSFLPSSQGAPLGAQCFRRQDLAASYKLSDADSDYPTDAIMSELRSNPHLGPMVGYESLPETKGTSPFTSFGESLSLPSTFSFDFSGPAKKNTLSNVKYFPANFDKNTLGQAMAPVYTACPVQTFPLRSLTVDNERCFVVNSGFQGVSFAKCSRDDCNQCTGRAGGLSRCVEQYGWVTVMVYCPHWQRGQRVKHVRVYLPQSCSCNRYLC
ncbi:uncharacterized protein LOC143297417 [Babylonia areolata]|uniref:uncharacterized protein LOC143297417 n=1 Tax=Babylonia areolata TaxID=304850 RepID=UPI003FD5D090